MEQTELWFATLVGRWEWFRTPLLSMKAMQISIIRLTHWKITTPRIDSVFVRVGCNNYPVMVQPS